MLFVNAPSLAGLETILRQVALTKPDYTMHGFPEYATGPDSLAPDQRNVLLTAALAIDSSQSTYQPVVGALVIGHADKALRKAVGERARFEQEVSQHRADSAAERLQEELVRRSHGAHYARVFRTPAIGLGNARPQVPNAATEQQMRMNRRVEIVLLKLALSRPLCRSI